MTEHTMTRNQRRAVLLRARNHIESSMYELATTIGLNADEMDYLTPDKLWQTDVQGVSQIDNYSDENKRPYNELITLSKHLSNVVEKLEGPNRVV